MKDVITSALMIIVLTVSLGLLYPVAVWGIAQLVFPHQANGSLVEQNGTVVGSELIGQGFTSAKYFQSRPSAAGSGYDAGASGGSNLGPTNAKLISRIEADVETLGGNAQSNRVPADLLTTSASGLDPHISPAAAEFQISRVARARGINDSDLRRIVGEFTEARQIFLLGEPRVNVLRLNLALDKISK
ncbi:MAG: potassium-transporting ATPase subunit KdpC [Acidobacteria bacterium]|nr:potassium-transporting ATPase subunit KdpC [Acidobacteriota bacterium]